MLTPLFFITLFGQALPPLGSHCLCCGTATAPGSPPPKSLPRHCPACQEIATATRVLHAMEQPSTCGKGNAVAPIAPPGHQRASSLAEFTDRPKRLKGGKNQPRFSPELGNRRSSRAHAEGICRNSFCFAASRASSADSPLPLLRPGDSSGTRNGSPRPQGAPGTGRWGYRGGSGAGV